MENKSIFITKSGFKILKINGLGVVFPPTSTRLIYKAFPNIKKNYMILRRAEAYKSININYMFDPRPKY